MQTTMHPAFQEKVDTLKALLARTQELVTKLSPR